MFAVDYDGVIADTNKVKAEWINKYLGKDVPVHSCDRTNCMPLIGEEQYNRMSEAVYGKALSLQAKPVPGALQALKILAKQGLVYVVSARTFESISFALEWLRQNKLDAYIHEAISAQNRSKVSVAGTLGCRVLIDDDPRHLTPLPGVHVRLILLKIGLKEVVSPQNGITVCTTWEDAVSKAIHES